MHICPQSLDDITMAHHPTLRDLAGNLQSYLTFTSYQTTMGQETYNEYMRSQVQKIVGATATERTKRASRSFTTPAGDSINYQPGELVDFFYQPSNSKDKSGWQQRATVIENLPSEGQVNIRHKGPEILVRYSDVRRHLDFSSLTF